MEKILYFSYNHDHFGFSDRTIITVHPEDKLVDEGSRVDLRCEVEADWSLESELRYLWKRDNSIYPYMAHITYNNKEREFQRFPEPRETLRFCGSRHQSLSVYYFFFQREL